MFDYLLKAAIFYVILFVSLLVAGTSQSFAQSASPALTVGTNLPTYSDGDQIAISGKVNAQLNVPISIIIKDPHGNIVLLGQVSANPDNTYSTTVTAGGDLWTAVGTYQIIVTYGSKENTAESNFQFSGSLLTLPVVINGQAYNATYTITNGKVLGIIPTTPTKTLTVRIQPSGNGTLSITLPRSLIDSKDNSGQDRQYVVENDGLPMVFNETRSDAMSRTLSIPFSHENMQITIMGTQIVPEFSQVSIIVLAISMLASVFFFKSRLVVKTI